MEWTLPKSEFICKLSTGVLRNTALQIHGEHKLHKQIYVAGVIEDIPFRTCPSNGIFNNLVFTVELNS